MLIYEKILREFQKHRVRYVIVGGIAVNLLGGLRTTADLDILVEMSDDNLKKIVKVMKRLGFFVKQPVDPMGIAHAETRRDWIRNKHMKAFNFYRGEGESWEEVDIIIESPVSYQMAKSEAVLIKNKGLTLPVISIKNLITMKKKAHRDIDRVDIEELKVIEKLRKKS